MRSTVIVMQQKAWDRWVKSASAATGGGGANAGKAVFDQNGCGACHTFKPANATGKIGPDLDNLAQDAQRAGKPLEDFVHESIVDPNAYIEKGYPANVMPPTFKSLPKEQLDALVQYLISGSGGAK
jgi:cytochrome c oxidase subunit II